MTYGLGIDVGASTTAWATVHDDHVSGTDQDSTHGGVIASVVAVSSDGRMVAGNQVARAGADVSAVTGGFVGHLGETVPIMVTGTPYGVESLIGHLVGSVLLDACESSGDARPGVIGLAHSDDLDDYRSGLLVEAARLAGVPIVDLELVTYSQARSAVAATSLTVVDELLLATGAAIVARSRRPATSAFAPPSTGGGVLGAAAGGAALGGGVVGAVLASGTATAATVSTAAPAVGYAGTPLAAPGATAAGGYAGTPLSAPGATAGYGGTPLAAPGTTAGGGYAGTPLSAPNPGAGYTGTPLNAPAPPQPQPQAVEHAVGHHAPRGKSLLRGRPRGLHWIAGAAAVVVVAGGAAVIVSNGHESSSAPVTSSAPVSTVTPATVTGTSLVGQLEGGTVDLLAFTVVAGEIDYFAAAPGCTSTDLLYEIDDSAGSTFAAAAGMCSDLGRVEFTDAGTFQIRIFSSIDSAGPYSVVRHVSRPDVVSAISPGQTVSGTIDQPGAHDIYTFTVAAGTVAYFAAAPGCAPIDLIYEINTPDGNAFAAGTNICGDLGRVEFDTAGSYQLVVRPSGSTTGAYQVVWKESRADQTSSIAPGQTVSGNIDQPGAHDIYTFTVAAGTVAYFAAASNCAPVDLSYEIDRADGNAFAGAINMCGELGRVEFDTAGTYQLLVRPSDSTTGAYQVIWKESRADQTSSIAPGQIVSGNIDQPGAHDIYTFTVAAGTVAYFAAAPDCTGTELLYSIDHADGNAFFASTGVCSDLGRVEFDTAGDYQLRVFPSDAATGPYQVVWKESRVDQAFTIEPGQTVSGTIDRPGARDIYTFTVGAGTVAFFNAAPGCTSADLLYAIDTGDGTAFSAAIGMCGNLGRVAFDTAGTYRLRVFPSGDATGEYSVTRSMTPPGG